MFQICTIYPLKQVIDRLLFIEDIVLLFHHENDDDCTFSVPLGDDNCLRRYMLLKNTNPEHSSSCLRLTTATRKPTCWNFASSRPGSGMPGHMARSAVRRGHRPKYRAPAFWVDHLRPDHIGTVIHDIGNHKILSTTSWKGREDGEHFYTIFPCK